MGLKLYCWAGLGLYCLLSAGDWMLTFALLQLNGSAYESNPVAAACLEQYGWRGLALYKAAGVVVFLGAVVLLMRRKPAVGAAVVTLGCAVLLSVTTYSHKLIVESRHEIAAEEALLTWAKRPARSTAEGAPPRPTEPCWFVDR
jgi:Domain of unknown function (DUF5658)